jgi:hypothetical protein
VVEICEMGTVNTGSAALKKPAVAQVYSMRASVKPRLWSPQETLDAHRDENGVNSGQIREIGGKSRQEVIKRLDGSLHLETKQAPARSW